MSVLEEKNQKAVRGKSCMNLQSHSKDSGFCSKHARKSLEGF